MPPKTDNRTRIPKLFVPYGQRVIIQVIREDQSEGGVALPDTLKLGSNIDAVEAWVVAVGPKCEQAKEGDRVLLPPDYKAMSWRYKGHEYFLIPEQNIFGFVDVEAVASIKEPSKLIIPGG